MKQTIVKINQGLSLLKIDKIIKNLLKNSKFKFKCKLI